MNQKIKLIVHPNIFEKYWGLTHVKIGKILQYNNDRTVGIIQSDQRNYVFKIAGSWKNVQGVTKDTKIFSILRKKSFKYVPQLIKTKNGENFIRNGKKFIYLLEYIEGASPKAVPQIYKKLAIITAKLHNIKNFPFKTDFDPGKIIKDLCKNSYKFTFGSEYRKIARSLPNFRIFPQTVIHTDIAPTNSIEKKNGDIIFVDWDDAGRGPTVLDLGSVLNEIIKEDTTFNEKNFQAFFHTYFKFRELSRKEKAYIVDGCLFFALMYIVFGDTEKRWKRILWIQKNRKMLEAYFDSI